MKLPAGILRNSATGRFHPIVFRPAPMPGGADSKMSAQRYRSVGHHTDGFASEEEAIQYIQNSDWDWTGVIWGWDGEGTPAMTEWFGPKGGSNG